MEPLTYTSDELRSYLPTGWDIVGDEPAWDDKKHQLTITVLDNVDFDWPVVITAAAADEHGRMRALDLAMDDVFRTRLGRHTRGMGFAG